MRISLRRHRLPQFILDSVWPRYDLPHNHNQLFLFLIPFLSLVCFEQLPFLKCESSVTVCGEDLLNGVDVGGSSQIQSQVVLHGGLHDGTGRALHRVVQAGVHDVLLGGARDALLEGLRRGHGDAASNTAEASLQGLLHRLYNVFEFTLD